MVYWIGNITAFGLGALMWPFSYIGGVAAKIYGFAWGWAENLAPVAMLLTFTMLLIAGIQMPEDKTVWETLVVWMVVALDVQHDDVLDEVETAMRNMFDETHVSSSSTTNSTYLKGLCSHVTSLDNGEEATVLLFEDDDDYDFPGTIGTNNNNVDDEVYQFKDLDDLILR